MVVTVRPAVHVSSFIDSFDTIAERIYSDLFLQVLTERLIEHKMGLQFVHVDSDGSDSVRYLEPAVWVATTGQSAIIRRGITHHIGVSPVDPRFKNSNLFKVRQVKRLDSSSMHPRLTSSFDFESLYW